jgi:uncharacterized membrane-anchored protein YhcB (DUF1043 family)
MDWSVLLAPGGLVCILAGMVAVNFKALFGRKDKVTEEDLAECKAELETKQMALDLWRDRYYNLLSTGKPANLAEGKEPEPGA